MGRIADTGKGHRAQVLLAEDDVVLRDLIRLTLECYGYTVVTAGNGEEAFGLFLRHRKQIRVVITDWDMPRISGLQLRRMLLEERPDLQVLLISGATPGKDRDGVFLQKPFSLASLMAEVRRMMPKPEA